MMAQYASILFSMILVNNFVLVRFLGICPFLGVSKKFDSAAGMGAAVTLVMVIAVAVTWPIQQLLVAWGLEYLQTIAFILVIATLVQLLEMVIKRFIPPLYESLGVFLPLITTNCAVLGVALFQTAREYSFAQAMVFSFGGGAGFTLALVLMASVRERLQLSSVPGVAQGTALSLMLAGLLSMAFMGFAGLGG